MGVHCLHVVITNHPVITEAMQLSEKYNNTTKYICLTHTIYWKCWYVE